MIRQERFYCTACHLEVFYRHDIWGRGGGGWRGRDGLREERGLGGGKAGGRGMLEVYVVITCDAIVSSSSSSAFPAISLVFTILGEIFM